MKDFGRWFGETTYPARKDVESVTQEPARREHVIGVKLFRDGTPYITHDYAYYSDIFAVGCIGSALQYFYPCGSCGDQALIGNLDTFHPAKHYCGAFCANMCQPSEE